MGEGLEGRRRLEHPLNGLDSVLFMKLTKQIFSYYFHAMHVLFNVFSGNLPGVWVKAGKFHHASYRGVQKHKHNINCRFYNFPILKHAVVNMNQ